MPTTLNIRVTPNAKANQIIAISEGTIRVKIRAAAKDGKANAELIHFLSGILDCRRSQFEIVKGETTRNKVVEIQNSNPAEIWPKLKKAISGGAG
jgi:uncharacterized protein